MEVLILGGDKLSWFFMLLYNMFLGSAHLGLSHWLRLAATVFISVFVFVIQVAFILLVDLFALLGETRL